jgi:uncharacterized protein YodC (DUF2158 family)
MQVISTGTIVRLNSGSPELEVIAHDINLVTVRWSSEDGVETGSFPRPCLYAV